METAPGAGVRAWLMDQVRQVRPWVALLFAFLFTVGLDRVVRRIEAMPDLVLRNEYRSQAALPYMLARMRRESPSIVFMGASVMQGVTNTLPEDAMPEVVERLLREDGIETHCFNTATLGHNMGDQYCIASAAMKAGADALVLSIHYKLFSSVRAVGNTLRFKDLAFYIRDDRDARAIVHDTFGISSKAWWGIRLRGSMANVWGLYRYRELLPYLATGMMDNPLQQAQDRFAAQWGLAFEGVGLETGRNILQQFDPAARDRDDIWKEMIDFHHQRDKELYREVEVHPYNPHLQMLGKLAAKAKKKGVPLLLYFTPFNRELNEREHYFSRDNLDHFKDKITAAAEKGGVRIVDMTDFVPSRYFPDMDHLTRKGHAALARALAPHVARLVAEESDR